ncbi:MAG: molybdopterin converting factor subunit 1 [Alphaproteobacteria bacterium]|nr:molybdopterin converting factor subunit 1 [Alphaproteobacteria bacterium]|tara:strand:+ start:276 stop:527 length:252 start_codon:yes stop_codon:yes gene_type:complete
MKILYFAQLKESIGKDEDIIDFSSEISVNQLIQELILKGEKYRKSFKEIKNMRCAVNCEYITNYDKLLKNKDEIAFFPPVTGG